MNLGFQGQTFIQLVTYSQGQEVEAQKAKAFWEGSGLNQELVGHQIIALIVLSPYSIMQRKVF